MSFQIVLNSVENNQRSPRHKQNTQSPTKQYRKIKMELADRIFELKKQQEDFAQQKAHLIQAHNHQRNNLTTQIKQLYHKLGQENQYWEIKVDQIRKQKKIQIQQLDNQWRNKYKIQLSKQIKQIINTKYKQPINNLNTMINQIKINITDILQSVPNKLEVTNKQYTTAIKQLQHYYEQYLQKLKKSQQKDQDLKIDAIMHIKHSQQKQHKKTKIKLQQKQKQLQNCKQQFQNKIYELRQQIWSHQQNLKKMLQKNQQLTSQNKSLKSELMSRVSMTTFQYEKKIRNIQQNWKNNVDSLNQKWKVQVRRLQLFIQKIQSSALQKQKLRQQRANKALAFFERRQARQEDVKLIQNLEIQLIRKQFELQRERQGLKQAKLELDNMDDIYKRVFYSASHHHSYSVGKNKNSGNLNLKKIKLPGILNRSTHPLKSTYEN